MSESRRISTLRCVVLTVNRRRPRIEHLLYDLPLWILVLALDGRVAHYQPYVCVYMSHMLIYYCLLVA